MQDLIPTEYWNEFRGNPLDSVGIRWNELENLGELSAMSNFQWIPLESVSFCWIPLDSMGICGGV